MSETSQINEQELSPMHRVEATETTNPQAKNTLVNKQESQLTETDIEKISEGARLRKQQLEVIDEYMAVKDYSQSGGFMGAMANEANEELQKALQAYSDKFDEPYPGSEDLERIIDRMPKEIGQRFDAHGIISGNRLESLTALLRNGVDLQRAFHTMPLVYDVNAVAIGAAAPYTDDGIIVVGPANGKRKYGESKKLIVDRQKATTNIQYVLLDRQFYFAIPQLEKAFPKIKFVKASEAISFMTAEVKKVDESADHTRSST